MAAILERRKHSRFNINLTVSYLEVDKIKTKELTKNLSLKGMFISKSVYLPEKVEIQFEILLKDINKKITPVGIVRYKTPLENDKIGTGIEFIKISIEDAKILEKFLSSLISETSEGVSKT